MLVIKETLTSLNTGKNMSSKDKAKLTRETRIKQQQMLQQAAIAAAQTTPTTGNQSSTSSLSTTTPSGAAGAGRKASKQLKN